LCACGKKEKGIDTNKQLHCSINYNVKKKKFFARFVILWFSSQFVVRFFLQHYILQCLDPLFHCLPPLETTTIQNSFYNHVLISSLNFFIEKVKVNKDNYPNVLCLKLPSSLQNPIFGTNLLKGKLMHLNCDIKYCEQYCNNYPFDKHGVLV
jgi:hypothetical protein